MNRQTFILLGTTLCVLASMWSSIPRAYAATLYVKNEGSTTSAGDDAIVDVFLDTEGKVMNVVEGTVSIESTGSIVIKDISIADSVLTLWPKLPTASADGKTISFTGGVPGGVEGSNELLFKVIFSTQGQGTIRFSPAGMNAFRNDGEATPDAVIISPSAQGSNGLIQIQKKVVQCNGVDFNNDAKVDSVDFSILLKYWKSPWPFDNPCVDANGDQKVDSIDFSMLLYQLKLKK